MPLTTITITFSNIFILLVSLLIDRSEYEDMIINELLSICLAWTSAGHCYQCNSRNPLCQVFVNATLKIDGTPCNGQCYTRLNRDDEYTIYRGCSWEHGFMNPQTRTSLVLQGNSVWMFCDTA